MCPFLEEDDNEDYYDKSDLNKRLEPKTSESNFFHGDKKFYLIGGATSFVVFVIIVTYIYCNTKPVDLGDLPVIRADATPIKMKPTNNEQVEHQDKLVYDNISGDTRVLKEHVAPSPEEPEIDEFSKDTNNEVLSPDEKDNIIREFDELAPKNISERQPAVVQRSNNNFDRDESFADEESLPPPINRLNQKKKKQAKKEKAKKKVVESSNLKESVAKKTPKGTIMIQVASVGTKTAAEAEYKRLLSKNRFLGSAGKRIMKVDLGEKGIKYRIQVGPFRTKQEANKVISELRAKGTSAYISR